MELFDLTKSQFKRKIEKETKKLSKKITPKDQHQKKRKISKYKTPIVNSLAAVLNLPRTKMVIAYIIFFSVDVFGPNVHISTGPRSAQRLRGPVDTCTSGNTIRVEYSAEQNEKFRKETSQNYLCLSRSLKKCAPQAAGSLEEVIKA